MARKTTTKTAAKRKTAKRGAKRPAGRKRKAARKPATRAGTKSRTKSRAKSRTKSAVGSASRKKATRAKTAAKTGRKTPKKATKAKTIRTASRSAAPAKTAKPVKADLAAKGTPAVRTGRELAIGSAAPDFRLTRDGGATVMLDDFVGRNLVIFFYPRANTPGCTREAIDFTRLSDDFARTGTDVIGVSADSIQAQESFRDGHNLTTPLLSDAKREMLNAYGAWGTKSNYGKTYEGIIRSTVLIDRLGRIAQVWRNVRVDGHAEAVLQAARSL
jgi:peroxiredoxin Q/BCP